MFQPEGVYVAMLTPFDAQGEIAEREVRRLVDFLIERGVHGLFPVSSTGEFVHMTIAERKRLMEIVVEQARGRVPVTPGIGSTCPKRSIELAEHARRIGAAGVVLMAPYFFKSPQEIVERHCEVVADAVDIPVILYNIPWFSNEISPATLQRLCRRPNVVAIKDSSGSSIDFANYVDLARQTKPDFRVLVGTEESFFMSLMMGGRGCMTAAAGIVPEVMRDIYDSTLRGEYERARERQLSLLGLIRLMKSLPMPVGFKLALEARGIEMGPPRQPLSREMEERRLLLKGELKAALADLLGAAATPARAETVPPQDEVERLVRQVLASLAESGLACRNGA